MSCLLLILRFYSIVMNVEYMIFYVHLKHYRLLQGSAAFAVHFQ